MTRKAHLTTERPNPEIAPARPAMVTVRQHSAANSPIQLNSSATIKNKITIIIFIRSVVRNFLLLTTRRP